MKSTALRAGLAGLLTLGAVELSSTVRADMNGEQFWRIMGQKENHVTGANLFQGIAEQNRIERDKADVVGAINNAANQQNPATSPQAESQQQNPQANYEQKPMRVIELFKDDIIIMSDSWTDRNGNGKLDKLSEIGPKKEAMGMSSPIFGAVYLYNTLSRPMRAYYVLGKEERTMTPEELKNSSPPETIAVVNRKEIYIDGHDGSLEFFYTNPQELGAGRYYVFPLKEVNGQLYRGSVVTFDIVGKAAEISDTPIPRYTTKGGKIINR